MNPVTAIQDLLAASGVPLFSAFLLGLLVAVSPCPLSTNLAALAYIGRQATEPGQVLRFGALYTGGRVVSYSALIAVLVLVGLEVSRVATLLQDAGQYLLGPLLVIVGLISLGLVPLRLPAALGARVGLGQRLAEAGPAGAFGLGALFALAFCPYSATLFFGALLPLALGPSGGLALAPAFAIGTGLPVLVAAFLLSAGVAGLARWFEVTARLERWLRRLMGLLFLIAGLYALSPWLSLGR
ncbi:MAG: aromatic aminobenezylarsenical efflux permease ArsG family transporter [Chloroflexota bacterium]